MMVAVPLKNLSDFWITLETSLTNCDINFILSGSRDCVISAATGATKFEITNIQLYVPVVTLFTQDKAKLSVQLKARFKRTYNWSNSQSNSEQISQNPKINHLILCYHLRTRQVEQRIQDITSRKQR